MLLSTEHDFLFVHIQRTGGGSVARALEPYAPHLNRKTREGRIARFRSRLPLRQDPKHLAFPAHATAMDVKRRIPPGIWDRLYKFAFVRNPYSRMLSLYVRIQTAKHHRHKEKVAGMSFSEYLDFEGERKRRSQEAFVCNPKGELIVDFVGRCESLSDDLAKVCGRLGLPQPGELPRLGARAHKDYRTYYDDAARQKVAQYWARDLELFGYDFDGIAADSKAEARA